VNRIQLATDATRRAARLRAEMGLRPNQPACPFDVAARLGITVRMAALPSLEGMYSPGTTPAIVVTSLRPAGRRRFTCGHEIGHHNFGHGCRLDEMLPDGSRSKQAEEFAADRFSAALLMPKLAVENSFVRRGWNSSTPSASQVFVVAQDLGVGFTTLVDHMNVTLRLLDHARATELSKIQLPKLRAQIAGAAVSEDVFPLDAVWGDRPLDVDVGDELLLPANSEIHGQHVALVEGRYIAVATGSDRIVIQGRKTALEVRVCRREFTGLAQYRHLEDCDD
jgi:hypothetical protein